MLTRLRSALPALIVLLAVLARLIPGPRTIDDSFITFRYARNLLAGQGFVYNPGEAVLGTTTPLYTLLMAGLAALSGGTNAPFAGLAVVVNALADAVTCLLLLGLGRRLGFERAGAGAALAWALAPFSVTFAIGGLETSLYVALLTGTAAAALAASGGSTPRPRLRILTALLASLALLTRPDALILLGPLALARLWQAWRPRGVREPLHWAELAAAILPYGAWALFAALAFGSPLPNSIAAKAAAYNIGPGESLIRLIQHYATPFLEQHLIGTPAAVGIGLILYPTLFLLGARRAVKANAPAHLALWAWALYPWLYLVTFAIPNPLIFRWYLTPPLPAYFFFILIGLDGVLSAAAAFIRRLPRHAAANPRPAGWVFALLLVPALVSLSGWNLAPDPDPGTNAAPPPAPDMAFIQLELLYRRAAAMIAPQMTAQSLLAAGDVGVLGFYTPARILDTVGLNSPVATRYYPLPLEQYVINYAIPTALILDQQPDWIVILEVYARRTFLSDPAFQARYEQVSKLDTDLYGSDGLLIYRLKINR